MKTKNLLVIILLIALSFNAFSQEQVVIKQVITNNLGGSTNSISTIEINTDCPVMIKSGKEDAVYLVGDIDKTKSNDYKGFCVLKENVLSINSPYKGDKKNLTITIELEESVYNYFLGENSKAAINNNLIYENSGTFSLQKNAELSVDGIVKLENLNIVAKENAKLKFSSINVEESKINLDKGSILILNGEINTINIKQAEGSHIAGNYKYKNIIGDSDDISDDLVNIIKGEVKNPEDTSSLVLKELSEAFSEVSDNLKKEGSNEVTKPIADAFKTVADNLKTKDGKATHKEKKKENKRDIGLQVGYGILSWSKKGWFNDNIFSHSEGVYALKNGSSWSLGFRYTYKVNSDFEISTGLGYESNIFRFETNVMLNDINGEKRIGFENDPSINAESKLVARYVTIPLFYRVRMRKNFYLHGGLVAGVNFRTSSTGFKRNYDIPNAEVEERWGTKYDNFKPVKLDVQAGFGWGFTNFYVKYSIIPLFKYNKEIEVYPYSVGVSFGL